MCGQERQPAPATSNGLQALRHCKYVSAFTPVSPKFQAAMHNKDHRPRAFQRQVSLQGSLEILIKADPHPLNSKMKWRLVFKSSLE